MGLGAAIALGAVIGLALGIVVSVATEIPLAPEVGAVLSASRCLPGRVDYPDVLRRPTHEILERFRAGGAALILIWRAFALSAVLFAALAILLATAVASADHVGEHLGYAFTGIWSILSGFALIDSNVAPDWLGILGGGDRPAVLALLG
jgi:hypothetical protein